jgi:hypothetical protein
MMLRKDIFVAMWVTVYLVACVILLQSEKARIYAFRMCMFSPFLVCWMVYAVLKQGTYKGKELGNDKLGYQDKRKSELGVF